MRFRGNVASRIKALVKQAKDPVEERSAYAAKWSAVRARISAVYGQGAAVVPPMTFDEAKEYEASLYRKIGAAYSAA